MKALPKFLVILEKTQPSLPPSLFAGIASSEVPKLKWLLLGQGSSRASMKDREDGVVLRRKERHCCCWWQQTVRQEQVCKPTSASSCCHWGHWFWEKIGLNLLQNEIWFRKLYIKMICGWSYQVLYLPPCGDIEKRNSSSLLWSLRWQAVLKYLQRSKMKFIFCKNFGNLSATSGTFVMLFSCSVASSSVFELCFSS